ncbi:killer suppression protein [Ectothiorhodospira marina]|uniref:Proteic killer suppression protein n=1 Tax=Ectothiorhodospira marina TaxID=1396821 RepID=A0A1H7RK40_9GAMM|nr:killer suppression protein [Ectothiorhodospira marina]SEL60616.1 proteic killer suppression protein [Ectothiorhodospira marina]
MEVDFKNKRLRKQLSEARQLQKVFGERRARLLQRRLSVLRAARSLGDFLPPLSGPERCHELTGNRQGQLSMDLDHPYRLIFCPHHEPPPRKQDGGLDWSGVTAILVLAVEDTHG